MEKEEVKTLLKEALSEEVPNICTLKKDSFEVELRGRNPIEELLGLAIHAYERTRSTRITGGYVG